MLIIDDHIKGSKKGSKKIEELKSAPETEVLPAVPTSTLNDLARRAKEFKANDYIEKPFDINLMIDEAKKKFKFSQRLVYSRLTSEFPLMTHFTYLFTA